MFLATIIFQTLTFIINLSFGLAVLFKNPRARLNQYYCVFSAALAFWNFSLLFTILGVWPQIVWSRLALTSGVIMASAFFIFSLAFPPLSKFYFRIRASVIILGILFSILT